MLDKNLMQERPSDNDVLLMWQNIQFIPRDIKNNTIVQDFIADLRKLYVNGDALIYSFDISESSVFDWFLYNDRIDDISFANNFLKSKALKTIAPELKIDDTINPIIRPLYVNDIFDLDGVLARLVYNGGAYVRDIFSPIEAREKAQMITKELFQDRYTEISWIEIFDAWSEFFYDITWDYTYIFIDKRYRRIWFLCTTDTD